MVKRGSTPYYSVRSDEPLGELIKAKASGIAVKFNNLVEVAGAIRKMTLVRANSYLKNVVNRKECVPFKKFNGGVGKCAQAKQFKTAVGRWPKNAAKCMLDLLRNVSANCEYVGKDPTDFFVYHVQVNQAAVATRRTYRAHGRITPYIRHKSHVQIIIKEKH